MLFTVKKKNALCTTNAIVAVAVTKFSAALVASD